MSIHTGYQTEHNHVHFLRKRLTFSDAAATYSLGWVPANASVIRGGVAVLTVFNAGTNNRLDLGYRNGGNSETDDTDEFGTDLALGTAGVIVADEMATAAVNTFPKGAEIVCVLDVTGTAATTGDCYVWVEYIVDNDGDTSS